MIEDPSSAHRASAGDGADPSPGRIVVLIEDLIFRSKVRETAGGLGMEATFAGSVEAVDVALASAADLLIVDLGSPALDPIGSIGRAKAKGVPVLAFGSHVDAAALATAQRAGADEVVPRSIFSARLPELIASLTARARRT